MEKREPASPLGLASGLVDPTPADVPHPFDHVVVTVVQLWLKDFQVTHLQPRGCKRDLSGKGKAAENSGRGLRCTPYPTAENRHQEPPFPSPLSPCLMTDSRGFKGDFSPSH